MALPFAFTAVTTAHGSDLDNNFAAVGALGTIPGTVAEINAIVFTAGANTPTISAYANYLRFSFIAVGTNTAATTFRYGALAILNVYKDLAAGPTALAGGEIVIGNLVTLAYDLALNAGAGGFHLVSSMPASLVLDQIGSTRGQTLYRGATAWGALAPGTSLQIMMTQGTGLDPAWASLSTVFAAVSMSAGALFYNNSAGLLSALTIGSAGRVLTVSTAGLPAWV